MPRMSIIEEESEADILEVPPTPVTYLVMAYIVMAHIVMADMVMGHIVIVRG